MTNETSSGYEMKDTLSWYASQKNFSIENQGMWECPKVENTICAQLSSNQMADILSLFPKNARERSILNKIIWGKSKWFDKSTLGTGIAFPTIYPSSAISTTAIIPGFTDYFLDDAKKLRANIELYQLDDGMQPRIRRTVHTEALAHEFAHTIIAPALYGKQKLRLPNGEIVDGHDFVMDLGRKAEAHIPISHYAEAYRDFTASEGLPFRIIDGDKKTAISEELAETISAIVLPFVLHNPQNLDRKESHLGNRREIVSGLEVFLNAQEVK